MHTSVLALRSFAAIPCVCSLGGELRAISFADCTTLVVTICANVLVDGRAIPVRTLPAQTRAPGSAR